MSEESKNVIRKRFTDEFKAIRTANRMSWSNDTEMIRMAVEEFRKKHPHDRYMKINPRIIIL